MASQPETTITSQQPSSKKPRATPDGSSSNVKVNLDESLNVVLPRSWNQSGECTIIIQIDPSDSTSLDLEGTQGAVGRMETDEEGVILDLKGRQYRGRIFPGPTAMLLSVVSKKEATEHHLKVDAISDEFVRLDRLGESIDRLQAKTKGDMEDYFFNNDDEDVNRTTGSKQRTETAPSVKEPLPKASTGKRRTSSSASGSKGPTKKRKTATKK